VRQAHAITRQRAGRPARAPRVLRRKVHGPATTPAAHPGPSRQALRKPDVPRRVASGISCPVWRDLWPKRRLPDVETIFLRAWVFATVPLPRPRPLANGRMDHGEGPRMTDEGVRCWPLENQPRRAGGQAGGRTRSISRSFSGFIQDIQRGRCCPVRSSEQPRACRHAWGQRKTIVMHMRLDEGWLASDGTRGTMVSGSLPQPACHGLAVSQSDLTTRRLRPAFRFHAATDPLSRFRREHSFHLR